MENIKKLSRQFFKFNLNHQLFTRYMLIVPIQSFQV